jgi:hypothetical protein
MPISKGTDRANDPAAEIQGHNYSDIGLLRKDGMIGCRGKIVKGIVITITENGENVNSLFWEAYRLVE